MDPFLQLLKRSQSINFRLGNSKINLLQSVSKISNLAKDLTIAQYYCRPCSHPFRRQISRYKLQYISAEARREYGCAL